MTLRTQNQVFIIISLFYSICGFLCIVPKVGIAKYFIERVRMHLRCLYGLLKELFEVVEQRRVVKQRWLINPAYFDRDHWSNDQPAVLVNHASVAWSLILCLKNTAACFSSGLCGYYNSDPSVVLAPENNEGLDKELLVTTSHVSIKIKLKVAWIVTQGKSLS